MKNNPDRHPHSAGTQTLTLMKTSAFISTRLRLLLAGGIAVSSASAPCFAAPGSDVEFF
jgi:hypothetical protein